MAKTIPLYNELIFLDVLPELHPDFIERIKHERAHKRKKPQIKCPIVSPYLSATSPKPR